jgi:sterol desaturase/sphingolipid hydroxylase (fatty acid hydroxylase superfamily)
MTTAALTAALPSTRVRTLPEAVRVFLRHASPWTLIVGSTAYLVALASYGHWTWGQLVVVGVLLAAQPFVEWLIHVYVLHAKPLRIGARTLDSAQARKHRAHHADPRNLDILFIPLSGHVTGALVGVGICLLLPTWPLRLALLATMAVQSLAYEWIHFLVHTDYKPKTRAYRRLYVGHRLHHYRNENYWYGVTRRFGDTVLRTNPAKGDVPLSPTCLSLAG